MPKHCQRDERGYRIPRKGSLAAKIYELCIKQGYHQTTVARGLGLSVSSVGVMLWRIRHPDAHNSYRSKKGISNEPVAEIAEKIQA
jgi:hypothetical protein